MKKSQPKNVFDREFLDNLEHETPFFLFSKEIIRMQFEEFKKLFPKSDIRYAMKANSEPELLKTLLELGSGFEAASVYELNMLKDVNVPPEKIVYGTAVKPAAHIREFAKYGVTAYAFDSLPEIEKIAANAPGVGVYIRVAVDDTGSIYKFSEKFGTSEENIVPLLLRARELGLVPLGVSFHVGSQASNPMAWAEAIQKIKKGMEELEKNGIKPKILNFGGGYPCAYASSEAELTLGEISSNTMKEYKKLKTKPQIMLEPGRGMVAKSAVLVTTVVGRVERNESTWLFLDTGVYDSLYEALAYQGSTRYKISPMRPSYDSGETLFALAGPTGDSWDIITREALLPRDMGVGDKLIIHDVGAYSLVVSSRFNGFPKPNVYFI